MTNQSRESHGRPSLVTFPATHRQPRGASWLPSLEESKNAPNSPKKGPFPAKSWGEPFWSHNDTSATPRRWWQISNCWPEVPNFGTLWAHRQSVSIEMQPTVLKVRLVFNVERVGEKTEWAATWAVLNGPFFKLFKFMFSPHFLLNNYFGPQVSNSSHFNLEKFTLWPQIFLENSN